MDDLGQVDWRGMTDAQRIHVVPFDPFRARYAPVLGRVDAETKRIGAALAAATGLKKALVVARCERHDQSTQWWSEMALLSLLAAAGIETTFVTDGLFHYDLARLRALGPLPRFVEGADARPPSGDWPVVVALPPSDVALQAREALGVPLVALMTKSFELGRVPLGIAPPPQTPLWHAFAGDSLFPISAAKALLGDTLPAWTLRGAPFPVNRYYAPLSDAMPENLALVFGTKDRDLPLAFEAIRRARHPTVAVLGNPDDREKTERLAADAGLELRWMAELAHLDLLRCIEQAAVIVNPVLTQSHYSTSLALSLGRPVLVTRSERAECFLDPSTRAVTLLPQGEADAWAEVLVALSDVRTWRQARADAARRALTHHDAERFFASAIARTLAVRAG